MIQRVDIPDRLITLQQNADAERAKLTGLDGDEREAQWKRWYEAAVEIQAAVTAHAQETGTPRGQIEAAVKQVVRHPAPEG
ncbi:hypothetical protein SBI_06909 [Streptomyces bingchenggensis BCW-1]|uniref:Uncharacterized protein n=1 Tax=Streptomyces bingchenggensis (strain BCW-1) TaxID=749414 RepID=D7C1G4_STRBB|nr:hypothetical protein SBI_06909 [Streptomyces bingchenggensis BCW-1]